MSLEKINFSKIKFFPLEKGKGFSPFLQKKVEGKNLSKDNSNISEIKLKKACRDFESLFLFQLLKTMRSTIPKDEEDGLGFGQNIFESIMDEEVAKKIAQQKSLGISEKLFNQFSNNLKEIKPQKEKEKLKIEFPTKTFNLKEKTKSQSLLTPAQPQPDKTATVFSNYDHIIAEASEKYRVDPHLLQAMIKQESSYNPVAISKKGAKGLMQLMESTAKSLGVQNIFDPKENILAGAKYIRQLLNRFNGDIKLALAAYNAGPKAVEKFKGIPPFKETINYVEKVWNFFKNLKGF